MRRNILEKGKCTQKTGMGSIALMNPTVPIICGNCCWWSFNWKFSAVNCMLWDQIYMVGLDQKPLQNGSHSISGSAMNQSGWHDNFPLEWMVEGDWSMIQSDHLVVAPLIVGGINFLAWKIIKKNSIKRISISYELIRSTDFLPLRSYRIPLSLEELTESPHCTNK